MGILFKEPPSSEITPESLWRSRRDFIKNAGLFAGTAAGVGAGLAKLTQGAAPPPVTDAGTLALAATDAGTPAAPTVAGYTKSAYTVPEPLTPFEAVSTYNNFYEFGLDKSDPARNAHTLRPRPWTVAIEGAVKKPQTVDIDRLRSWFPLEERVYRMRCVEAWSMVIPWLGFPLAKLIERLEPTSKAKYVAFQTLHDTEQMPGQNRSVLDWPYVEGLRMDEAMNPLTLMAVGLYGKALPNQNGAPIRLVTPWKYGFKGCKSIVRIRFQENQPETTWNAAAPNEYGFFANVNPEVDHPRWSQANERRIGEWGRRKTLMFNGYAEQVAGMYKDLDLRKFF